MNSSVDIIIPCYNMSRYLPQAIDSALAQTHAPVRVVVVDDGSTEDIRCLVESYAARVDYIRQENRGQAAARNAGIAHTNGDFVCFLDADDILLPSKTAVHVAFLNDHPSVDLVHGQAFLFTDDDIKYPFAEWRPYEEWEDYLFPLSLMCPFPIHSALMRRSSLQRFGVFAECLRGKCEDWAYWLNCVLKGATFSYQPEVVCLYRKHKESVSSGIQRIARNEWFWMPRLVDMYKNSGRLSVDGSKFLACGVHFVAIRLLVIGEKKGFTQLNSLAADLVTMEGSRDFADNTWSAEPSVPASVLYMLLAKEVAELGFPQLGGFIFLHAGDWRMVRHAATHVGFSDDFDKFVLLLEKYLDNLLADGQTYLDHTDKALNSLPHTGEGHFYELEERLPKNASFASYLFFQLGRLAELDGQMAKTVSYMKKAAELNPYFWEYQEYLLRVLCQSGDRAEGAAVLKKLLASGSDCVPGLYFLGKLRLRQFRLMEAMDFFLRAFAASRLNFSKNVSLDLEQVLLRYLGRGAWRLYRQAVMAMLAR